MIVAVAPRGDGIRGRTHAAPPNSKIRGASPSGYQTVSGHAVM
jgi:hypothetical protein